MSPSGCTRTIPVLLAICFALTGCGRSDRRDFLGSAVVETNTYEVSTTAQGELVAVYKAEGQRVAAHETLAVVDTVPIVLKRQELEAGIAELDATIEAKEAEIQAQELDVEGLSREFDRIDELFPEGPVSEQQWDDLRTRLESARARLKASRSVLASLFQRKEGMRSRIEQVEQQREACFVTAPSSGTILTKYRFLGEIVGAGNPIFAIGNYDTLYADFFVPEPVLASLQLAQPVRVRVDYEGPDAGGDRVYVPGSITWISDEAEFTPKNIQTRESRNELVFRVRATIPNETGVLKRGLPVEIWR